MRAAPADQRSLATLYGIVILDLIGFGIVIPILPFYAESFGADASVLGLLVTAYAAMQVFCAPLWGRLSDRIGRRPVLLLTISGTSLALGLLGWAPNLVWLFVARLLGGIFGANISVASAYIVDVTDDETRTRYLGLLGACFGVGFLLGPALGGLLAPRGYAVPMVVAAILAAINALIAFWVLREPERHQRRNDEILLTLPAASKKRTILLMCTATFLFTVAVSQLETLFAFFMKDRFAFDAQQVAWVMVGMALVMVVIQGGAIRALTKRFDEKTLLIGGALLLVPALPGVALAPSVMWLMLPLLLSAIGRAICHPTMMALVAGAADPQQRGAVMGTFQSASSLARVVGPLVAGFLYDHDRTGLSFWAAS